MGKFFAGVFLTVVVIALLFFFGVFKLGVGDGKGSETKTTETTEKVEKEPEQKEVTVVIVVKQDSYFIEEKEVTLSEIKERVTDSSTKVKVVIENNYAGAETWDSLKNSLLEWGITPIEQ